MTLKYLVVFMPIVYFFGCGSSEHSLIGVKKVTQEFGTQDEAVQAHSELKKTEEELEKKGFEFVVEEDSAWWTEELKTTRESQDSESTVALLNKYSEMSASYFYKYRIIPRVEIVDGSEETKFDVISSRQKEIARMKRELCEFTVNELKKN